MAGFLAGIDELVDAICAAKKPIAFLLGSPLSTNPDDPEHGVPGVSEMVSLVREAVERSGLDLNKFDAYLKDKQGADAYQTAIGFLQATAGQDAVNEVIQRAVLRAHRHPTALADPDAVSDGAPDDWYLPRSIDALAAWITKQSPGRVGAILTTNFDPLIELAIQAHGGSPHRVVVDADGRIEPNIELQEGVVKVVHLHGYWRGSDTLHVPQQLVSSRPRLNASLQRLLSRHVLVAVAYSGWDDAFTGALESLLYDDKASVDVRWAFHESDVNVIEARYKHLFRRVGPAVSRGRFVQYAGIDCHQLGDRLASKLPDATGLSFLARSPVDGWVVIDTDYIASHAPGLTATELTGVTRWHGDERERL